MGCNIELTSITYAIKARDLLRKEKMRATVEKSLGKQKSGCAYSVAVAGDCVKATKILNNAGFKINGIN